MKEKIRDTLLKAGASAVGFASAGEVDDEVKNSFDAWISDRNNGEMKYLERHVSLRRHTDSVLPEASTVISTAFSYVPEQWLTPDKPYIAAYAYGEDYHVVLRDILKPVVTLLQNDYGGKWRICIDSAPLEERYWAMKSGIGKKGLNGALIAKDCGSLCFLVEILTTVRIKPDKPSTEDCGKCGLCVSACPNKALKGDGTLIANKCINYLTIEKQSEFSEEERTLLKSGPGYLYGCDRCLRVCHHNKNLAPSCIPGFRLLPEIKELTPEKILSLDESSFKKTYRRSPLSYAGFSRLLRNARNLTSE